MFEIQTLFDYFKEQRSIEVPSLLISEVLLYRCTDNDRSEIHSDSENRVRVNVLVIGELPTGHQVFCNFSSISSCNLAKLKSYYHVKKNYCH